MAHLKPSSIVIRKILSSLAIISLLSACVPFKSESEIYPPLQPPDEERVEIILPTPLPTRPPYPPGTLVEYVVQTGDTLPALAAHFNTTESEIRAANPILPNQVSTLPPGLPLQIPIYYQIFWGSPHQILPDSQFINGPSASGFSAEDFISGSNGWLKDYTDYLGDQNRRGGEIVDYVATIYSINPRLLLAILEYQTGAMTMTKAEVDLDRYPLGYGDVFHLGLGRQLIWAANTLNNGYYGWRTGDLSEFEHLDKKLERPDPWQNACTVALQYYFSKVMDGDEYTLAISGEGLEKTYHNLFGSYLDNDLVLIPGSLSQPELRLPFLSGRTWAFTGGPHTGWGEGAPLAAIDFAPPSVTGGCSPSNEFVVAMADGVVVRAERSMVTLDLDGDGDEHTGWVIFYLHIAAEGMVKAGTRLKSGDPVGKPSCEGGEATGTHVHISRKYNGEWIPADGPLAFNLEGWIAHNGPEPYKGTLTRYGQTITASVASDISTRIQSEIP